MHLEVAPRPPRSSGRARATTPSTAPGRCGAPSSGWSRTRCRAHCCAASSRRATPSRSTSPTVPWRSRSSVDIVRRRCGKGRTLLYGASSARRSACAGAAPWASRAGGAHTPAAGDAHGSRLARRLRRHALLHGRPDLRSARRRPPAETSASAAGDGAEPTHRQLKGDDDGRAAGRGRRDPRRRRPQGAGDRRVHGDFKIVGFAHFGVGSRASSRRASDYIRAFSDSRITLSRVRIYNANDSGAVRDGAVRHPQSRQGRLHLRPRRRGTAPRRSEAAAGSPSVDPPSLEAVYTRSICSSRRRASCSAWRASASTCCPSIARRKGHEEYDRWAGDADGRRHDDVPQHRAAARAAHDHRGPGPSSAERAGRARPRGTRTHARPTSTRSC